MKLILVDPEAHFSPSVHATPESAQAEVDRQNEIKPHHGGLIFDIDVKGIPEHRAHSLQYRDRWPTPAEAAAHATASNRSHSSLWMMRHVCDGEHDVPGIIVLDASNPDDPGASRYVCWETEVYNADDGREYMHTYFVTTSEDAAEIGPILIAPIDRDGNAVEWPG